MTSRNRFFRMVFLLLLFGLASTLAWSDTMVGVTSPGGQGANDSVSWAQLGANGTLLGASFNASSGKALSVSGSLAGANSVTAVACAATPCSWRGSGFTAGDTLIWTSDGANGGNGPLTLSFGKSISGAGAFIQADGPGAFTAQIQAFNGSTSLGSFSVNSDANGDAAYIGIIDQTGENITSVAFTLNSCVGTCSDFAIGTVNLNTGGATTFPLTVTLAGTGSGTVTSSPAGINCPGTCSASFNSGTSVTLTAAAASGSTFAGWSGACTGIGTCTVTMNAAQSVTATFNAAQFPLTVTLAGTGGGTVTSNPTGIHCPGACTANFNNGTSVTLTATAANGSTFARWSGACTGTGTCTVTMNAAQSVTATFNVVQFALSVSLAGNGSGTVTSNPSGINCPGTCTANFNSGTSVTLTATPASGSTFAGWSGACSGAGTCTVTMNSAQSVTATFNTIQFPLTVKLAGTGSGTVTSSPSGINCPGTCTANFNSGTSVTLTATAANGSTFAGWSGACTGSGTCTVTMNSAQSVTATFSASTYTLMVVKLGKGSGTVKSNPAGIKCGTSCSHGFAPGTVVTLTETPALGHTFGGWGGACSGTAKTCKVKMAGSETVDVTFN